MTVRIASLFATPVYTLSVPNSVALNGTLIDLIAKHRGQVKNVDRSNIGGWQSDIDLLQWGGNAAAWLAKLCTNASQSITATPDGDPATVKWQPEMWVNVNRPGDSNQSHWHPGSFLSFVYYVDDGYGLSSDRALGGELVFVDPRMPFLRMRTPDLRCADNAGNVAEHETWVRPFSGLLIGFPSFLGHSVRPYRGTATRTSIAINMIARPA